MYRTIQILMLLLIFSNCTSDSCPENEELIHCEVDEFIGTWNFIGYDHNVNDHTCISQASVNIDNSKNIRIEKADSTSNADIKFNQTEMIIINSGSDRICKAIDNPPTNVLGFLIGDSQIILENPIKLKVKTRFLIGSSTQYYRKSN